MKKFIAIGLFCLVGCGFLKSPAVQTFESCVAEGAISGKSVAELVIACGQDVPAVIAEIVKSSDPAVAGSKAAKEASRVH